MTESKRAWVNPRGARWQLGVIVESGARNGAVWLRSGPPETCDCCDARWFSSNLIRDGSWVLFEAERTELMPIFCSRARSVEFSAWEDWWQSWRERHVLEHVLADLVAGRRMPQPPRGTVARHCTGQMRNS